MLEMETKWTYWKTLCSGFNVNMFFFFKFQLEVLKQYLDEGGNVLVVLGEGGEKKYDTNINFLLEEFGIMVNNGTCWNFPEHRFKSYVQ